MQLEIVSKSHTILEEGVFHFSSLLSLFKAVIIFPAHKEIINLGCSWTVIVIVAFGIFSMEQFFSVFLCLVPSFVIEFIFFLLSVHKLLHDFVIGISLIDALLQVKLLSEFVFLILLS